MKKKLLTIILALFVFVPVITFAADGGSSAGGAGGSSQGGAGGSSQPVNVSIPNPIGFDSISDLVFAVVNFVISFSYVVIAFFLILAGFKFVTAQGSEDKLTDAKNTLKYTIIGAILIVGAQIIVQVLKDIFTQIASS